MATDIDLQQIENATKQLLEGRVDSVRQLAQARAHVAAKLDEVRAAESAGFQTIPWNHYPSYRTR